MVGDRGPTDTRQLVNGGMKSDGAKHVGRTGLLPLWRICPHDLVEVDEVDCSAASQEGIPRAERPPWSDENARPERRIHLVAAPRDEVGVCRQRPVGSELSGIDEHRYTPLVGGFENRVERWHPTRHIRGAGDGEEAGRWQNV